MKVGILKPIVSGAYIARPNIIILTLVPVLSQTQYTDGVTYPYITYKYLSLGKISLTERKKSSVNRAEQISF